MATLIALREFRKMTARKTSASHLRRGTLGSIRNRKTEEKIIQNGKTAKKFGQNRKPNTKASRNRFSGDKWGIQSKLH